MKILVAVIAVLALATPATASAPSRDPRVPGLQKQVRQLRSQLTAIRAQVQKLEPRMTMVEAKDECHFAIILDNEGAFYDGLRILGKVTGILPTLPPGPGRYDDKGSCNYAGLQRSP